MTTERRGRCARGLRRALATALLCLLACATSNVDGGLSPETVAGLPVDVRAAYETFARRCSRCHTLARPLDADIKDIAHWRHYVARMRRQAGSGISEVDAQVILRFLEYYAHDRIQLRGRSSESSTDRGEARGTL